MNSVIKNIPNAITCGNLLCGCLAIIFCLNGNLILASTLIGIAAVLDFFDGFAARMLKVSSPIGKDLDSLADMVTFGVVPGLIMYQLIKSSIGFVGNEHVVPLNHLEFYNYTSDAYHLYLPFIGLLIPVFSAIRLAKFNNDTRQSESFIGLPTPANAIFIGSLVFLNHQNYIYHVYDNFQLSLSFKQIGSVTDAGTFFSNWLFHPGILIVITVLFSFLLVAELPLFSLKFKHFKWTGNEVRFIFLVSSLILILFFTYAGISLVIILYILLSFIYSYFK